MKSRSLTHRYLLYFGLFIACGVLFAAGAATEERLRQYVGHSPAHWDWIFRHMLPPWVILAALGALAALVAHRVRIGEGRTGRAVLIHVLTAPVFVVAHLGLLALYWQAFGHIDDFAEYIKILLVNYTISDLITYWAITGTVHALDYFRASQKREITALELKASLAEAKLQSLRRQLDPHFVCNTLNSVAMLIRDGRGQPAIKMLADISHLLRYVLREADEPQVTLKEELGFIEQYVEIERTRFHDSLLLSIAADEECMRALVPTLVLQPLVENAVKHGIAKSAQPGTIAIRARRASTYLVLQVEDDGPGLPVPRSESVAGLGLRNTRQRLMHTYGSEGELDLRSGRAGGAVATLRIPYRIDATSAAETNELGDLV